MIHAKVNGPPADAPADGTITAIPYYASGAPQGRRDGRLAASVGRCRPRASCFLAARAPRDHLELDPPEPGINDQLEPAASDDDSVPLSPGGITWARRNGPVPDFAQAAQVKRAEVFRFDDRRIGGQCRVPAAWRVLYRDGDAWKPVAGKCAVGNCPGSIQRRQFRPGDNHRPALEVQLSEGKSSGILEWKLR